MLKHGGNLRDAATQYAIPFNDWIDLSTGINPQSFSTHAIGNTVWQRLPEENDGLREAACAYYNCPALLPTAGSQAALQILPALRSHCHIAMPRHMYQEHAHAWQQHGHKVTLLDAEPTETLLHEIDVLLLCNPNNPTGERYAPRQLLQWQQILATHQGWLIVDEAFMDATPESSIAQYSHLTGLIVLRSLGKFFGLAGARVGFLLAAAEILNQAQEKLGPWTVSGPSRNVAKTALEDVAWQKNMRAQLHQQSQQLQQLLASHGLISQSGTALFQYVAHPQAIDIHHQLAEQGIWVRLFDTTSALRFGLPATQSWQTLSNALSNCKIT